MKNFFQPSQDPAIYYELKPNVRMKFCGGLIVTGPEQYRIPSQPRVISPEAVRVAVIGDSSSFGWGVDYEDTYADIVCKGLSRITDVDIDLRNYSVPAHNSAQQLRVLQTRVASFGPDLVILHHDNNDADPITPCGGTCTRRSATTRWVRPWSST